MNEFRIKALKSVGLIASLIVGGTMVYNGQTENGVGIIAAALSSSTAFRAKE